MTDTFTPLTYSYKGHSIQFLPSGNWYNIIVDGEGILETFDDYYAAKLAAESIIDDLIF
jgi:hypothetical protein